MSSIARELRSWFALTAIVVALVFGFAMRSATVDPALVADSNASTLHEASPPPDAEPMSPLNPPLSGGITPPTRESAPTPMDAPAASAAPAAVAAVPSAPPPAPAPPARDPTPTPVPVADPNPVLVTDSRVSGPLGSTLSLEDYSVTIRPKAVPSSSQCTEYEGYAVYELVVVYATPFYMPYFDAESTCMDGPAFPMISGATYEVFVERPPGSPIQVSISPNDGAHVLIFAFH